MTSLHYLTEFLSDDEWATVFIDISVSSLEEGVYTDSATVLVDLQTSGTEQKTSTDAATVLVDLTVLGGECYSTFSAEFFGEGDANLRWSGDADLRWSSEENLRWSAFVSIGDTLEC